MFLKVFGISFISLALLQYVSSSTTTAYEGDTVGFQCTLKEFWPPADISWFIEWQNILPHNLRCDKEETVERFTSRGDYATSYNFKCSWGKCRHWCKLVITNVTIIDSGTFRCVHDGTFINHGTFYTTSLQIFERPSGLPKCAFSSSESAGQLSSGAVIQLTCSLEEEKSVSLYQRYFAGTNELKKSSDKMSRISLNYTLQDIDNGCEFVCQTDKGECKVIPFILTPNATITQITRMPTIGSNVSLHCCGTAIPWVSRYRWYSNGDEVFTGHQQFVMSKENNCSVLMVLNVTQDDNNTQILCDVSNPNNVTASAIAVLTLFPPSDITHTTSTATEVIPGTNSATFQSHISEEIDKSSRSFVSPKPEHKSGGNVTAYIIISLILIAIIFAITVLLFLKCRKRESHSRQRNKRGNQSTNETLSLEQRLTTNTESPPESPMPRYQDYSTANLQHEDVLSGSRIDAVQSNAEGLTYASLDLNNCAYPDQILHPAADEAVIYADIKHQHSV